MYNKDPSHIKQSLIMNPVYNKGKKKMSCVQILSLFFFVLGVFLNPKGDISRGIIIQPLLIS